MGQHCPTREELLAFHLGTLAHAAVDSVAAHVEACPDCEKELEKLDATADQLLSGLRRPVPSSLNPDAETHDLPQQLPEAWPELPGYRYIGALGRGGMGVIFEAHQDALSRRVAVKRLQAGTGESGSRSRAEAEMLGQLLHPNIVQIYEILDFDSGLFLILELVDGGSLEKHLRGRPAPPRDTARFIETIARALHHAHTLGIIHRDIKPANILLARQPQTSASVTVEKRDSHKRSSHADFNPSDYAPKVADFGIAKRLNIESGHTREGYVIGTPTYMAPEQAGGKGEQIGPATDVYSLGVILYEMLTGRVPLQGPTTLDTLLMVQKEEPVPPRRLQPGIPRDLETLCLKCLQKDPARRYTTAEAFASDLRRYLDGKPVLARRTPAWEKAWKWAKREPRIAALSAALVLALVGGLTLVTVQWRSEREARTQAQENERKADRLAASVALDRGLALAEVGKLNQGLLWMARSLELAIRSRDAELEHAIRSNLAAWTTFLPKPSRAFPHRDWVWAVAFSPDGTKVLTASKDQTARLWDAQTGNAIGEPMHHDRPVWSVAFGRDGSKILTGCGNQDEKEGRVCLWDVTTTRPLIAPIHLPDSVNHVEFSPDGQSFLTVAQKQCRLWKTADAGPIGDPLTHPRRDSQDPRVRSLMKAAFSPDGKLVATAAEDGTVRFWDSRTGKATGLPLSASGPILALAFSPDGHILATGTQDGLAQLWDVATRAARGPALRHSGRVRAMAFSNDGELLATAAMEEDILEAPKDFHVTGGEVRVWQTRSGQRLGSPLRHPAAVWSVAFSPDNRTLLTGSRDATARFFLLATGAPMGDPLTLDGTVTRVAFRNDGVLAVAASAGGDHSAAARTWETPTGQGRGKPILLNIELLNVRFTPDGRNLLATATDGSVRPIDLQGQPVAPAFSVPTYVTAIQFSPDGKSYVLGTVEGLLQYRDLLGSKERYSIRTGTQYEALAFSPDGRTFLAGDRNGTLWHRETESGRAIGEPFRTDSPFWSVQFTPDGKKFIAGTDAGAQLWDLDTRQVLQKTPIRGQVTSVTLFPDGECVLLNIDGFAREWNFATDGALRPSLVQPEGGIDRFSLSHDGKRVLISGADKLARLWDVATGKQLGPSLGTRVRPVAFTRDDHLMAVGDLEGRIVFWEKSEPLPGSSERIRLQLETLTRMELDRLGTVRLLKNEDVSKRMTQLENTGAASGASRE